MKKITFLTIAGCALAPLMSARAGNAGNSIAPGDLMVFQTGNSSVGTSGSATPLVIDEINPALTNQTAPVQSFNISTLANPLFTNSQGSTGDLTLSDNGTLLSFVGWEGNNGTATENTTLARGAGTLDASGNYALAASYNGSSGKVTRTAYSPDNTNWYFGESDGVFTQGSSTPFLNSPSIYDIQGNGTTTYGMVATSGSTVIGTITPATPNGTSFAYAGLSGLPADKNAVGFAMTSYGHYGATIDDTLYVADDASGSTNYIDKFSLVGSSWVSSGSFGIGSQINIDQLIAEPGSNGNMDIFFTGDPTSPSHGYAQVDELVDSSGYDSTISLSGSETLFSVTSSSETLLGISFAPVPEPVSYAFFGFGAVLLFIGSRRIRRGIRAKA
jgi:hypothetical protein